MHANQNIYRDNMYVREGGKLMRCRVICAEQIFLFLPVTIIERVQKVRS